MRRSEEQLGADIKAGLLARVYMLYGEEDYLIRMRTDKLISLAVPEEALEMNFRKYSLVPNAKQGTAEDRPPQTDELSDFAESMPFFAEHKCVLLKNFDPDVLDKDEFESYLALINDIPETSVVIFTRESMGDDPKQFREKLGKAKMKKLIETVDRNGIVCEMNHVTPEELSGMAIGKCRRAGCELSVEDAAFLGERVGGSLSLLQTELDKLCAYRGSGKITRGDIEMLVPKRIESKIFDLAEELFAGRVGRAMEIINALFIQRAEPNIILATLSNYFVALYHAKLGLKAKKSSYDTASALKYGNKSFLIRNGYAPAKHLTEAYLGECIAVLYNANKQLNSSGEFKRTNSSNTSKRITIERVITEIASIPRQV